jgi:hypothetical protein
MFGGMYRFHLQGTLFLYFLFQGGIPCLASLQNVNDGLQWQLSADGFVKPSVTIANKRRLEKAA